MRKPIIAGNWKMNKTPAEATQLIEALKPLVKDAACEVVVCPPFVCLPAAVEAARGSNIQVGAQNLHFAKSGAYTGEISADMLTALGVTHVIIGHSERRQYFAETDATVNMKIQTALAAGLTPIVCVGEPLDVRKSGGTKALVSAQTKAALAGLTADQVRGIVIAYEPIWAIGTGETATDEQANETIGDIRAAVEEAFGAEVAQTLRIQYGGSMNPGNASSLMRQPQIDGGLIGGASLKAEDFSKVVHF